MPEMDKGVSIYSKRARVREFRGFLDPPIAIRWLQSEWGLVGCEEEVGMR